MFKEVIVFIAVRDISRF